MKTPSVFVFDMGRVLLNYDPMLCIKPYLSEPADREEIARVAFASEEWKLLDAGKITDEEALSVWQSRLPARLHTKMAEIFENWHLHMPAIPQMTALVQDLHRAGYPIYLLSNVSLRFAKLREHYPVLSLMQGCVTSAEELVCKPDRGIYEILLGRYALNPEDCIFIDDQPANIQSAVALGMQGYVFDGDTNRLRSTLREMGVQISHRIVPENVGLVLEGGAQRGIFTAGVLDKLMEEGFHFPYVVGVSAGCCNAYSYVSEQIGRTRECMMPIKENHYFGMGELIRTGKFMNLEKIFVEMPKSRPFDYDTFFASEKKLEIVATSMKTGQAEYLTVKKCKQRLAKVGMASCSMPIFAAPVKIGETMYLDGGVSDSIPVARAMEQGCEKAVVILTRLEGGVPTTSEKMKQVYRRYFRNYPAFATTLCRREEMYREQLALLESLEAVGKVFVIRPTVPTVSRMEQDCQKMEDFYRHGYESMASRMDELRAFLGCETEKNENGCKAD